MMIATQFLAVSSLLASTTFAQDTIFAVYIFHRHGDRTPKALPPANLTTLGYDEVISAGQYYNQRYVNANSPTHIHGLSSSIVNNAQIAVSAPTDNVLQNSATGFLQGLYPPVGTESDTLANGTTVNASLNGYQLIPIVLSSSGTGSEDTTWLQATTGCVNAVSSSNNYFNSQQYLTLLNSTQAFWTRLAPVVNRTFASSYMTYKNAYSSKYFE